MFGEDPCDSSGCVYRFIDNLLPISRLFQINNLKGDYCYCSHLVLRGLILLEYSVGDLGYHKALSDGFRRFSEPGHWYTGESSKSCLRHKGKLLLNFIFSFLQAFCVPLDL